MCMLLLVFSCWYGLRDLLPVLHWQNSTRQAAKTLDSIETTDNLFTGWFDLICAKLSPKCFTCDECWLVSEWAVQWNPEHPSALSSCPPPPPDSALPLYLQSYWESSSTGHRTEGSTGAMAVFSALHLLFLFQLLTSSLAQVRQTRVLPVNRPDSLPKNLPLLLDHVPPTVTSRLRTATCGAV